MSKNKVQFQVGFSALEFIDHYGTEEQCVDYLEKLKWPMVLNAKNVTTMTVIGINLDLVQYMNVSSVGKVID